MSGLVRTFLREDIEESRAAWAALRLGPSWVPVRELAASRGMLYPPFGTRWDSWEDAEPSQFALVARAHLDTPETLREAIATSSSWGQVIGRLLRDRDGRRQAVDLAERDDDWRRRDEPDGRQALTALGAIVGRIRDSVR